MERYYQIKCLNYLEGVPGCGTELTFAYIVRCYKDD